MDYKKTLEVDIWGKYTHDIYMYIYIYRYFVYIYIHILFFSKNISTTNRSWFLFWTWPFCHPGPPSDFATRRFTRRRAEKLWPHSSWRCRRNLFDEPLGQLTNEVQMSQGQKTRRPLLSIEFWLLNRDPYDDLWNNPHPNGYDNPQ